MGGKSLSRTRVVKAGTGDALSKLMSVTEIKEIPKVIDPDGYEIRLKDLVLYQQGVYKVTCITYDDKTLSLWNTKKSLVRVPVDEVQWLSEDTITPCDKCHLSGGKEKKEKSPLSGKIHLGGFVRRKNGTGRVAKVTKMYESKYGTGLITICIEYFYDGAHCTGQLYLDEVEPADKPKDWDKWMGKWVGETSGGRHISDDGSEYWIGGVGSRSSRGVSVDWERGYRDERKKERKEKKEKKDSIERGDLIREEVNRLKSEGEKPPEPKLPKIKTRKPKEDW